MTLQGELSLSQSPVAVGVYIPFTEPFGPSKAWASVSMA